MVTQSFDIENTEAITLKSQRTDTHSEDHLGGSGPYIKVIVFGGLDGILSEFAVVAGCAGVALSPMQTLCVSIGSLLASAFSMGYGEYVSEKAERDYIDSERRREETEVEEKPELEKEEMFDIYTRRYKFSPEDARSLVDVSFRNKDFFLRHMMVEELGILLADDDLTPSKKGWLMFWSFCILGAFPLLGFFGFYLGEPGSTASNLIGFSLTSVFSLIGTMSLGYFKGNYMKQSPMKSALAMTLNGIVVGAISYLMGWILSVLFPEANVPAIL